MRYGTPSLTYDQILPLLDIIDERGGELGFGLIDSSSNWPLHRYYAPEIPAKPEISEEGKTPAEIRRLKKINTVLQIKWLRQKKERTAELEELRQRYRERIAEDLLRPWNATSSDIYGSVFRCNLYLSEETPELSATPQKFLIVISDAEHNTKEAKLKRLSPGVNLVIVNGQRWEGSLSAFKPETFEGIDAAFRFVLTNIKTAR